MARFLQSRLERYVTCHGQNLAWNNYETAVFVTLTFCECPNLRADQQAVHVHALHMAATTGDNITDHDEEDQASKWIHAAFIRKDIDESLPTAEEFDDTAANKKALVSINQSVISQLSEIIKDDPTVDLWLRLRGLSREYKAERKAYTNEHQSPQPEGV